MKILVALLFPMGVFAGGCSAEEACTPASPDQIAAARRAMDLVLLDSESARFRDVCVQQVINEPKNSVLCGLINAKNSMGAYSGFTRFSYVIGAKEATIVPLKLGENRASEMIYCVSCVAKFDDCMKILFPKKK